MIFTLNLFALMFIFNKNTIYTNYEKEQQQFN